MKFCVNILCRIETCQTNQSDSPHSQIASNTVVVTTVARPKVFQPNWASKKTYYYYS